MPSEEALWPAENLTHLLQHWQQEVGSFTWVLKIFFIVIISGSVSGSNNLDGIKL